MKSIKHLAGTVLLAVSAHAMADPFSGFYVGAGPQWLDVHYQSSVNNAGTTTNMPTTNASGLVGHFIVGASQDFSNQFYLAEELAYTLNSKTVNLDQETAGGLASFSNTAYLSQQFNAGLKLGMLIDANNVIYLHPLLAYAKINPSLSLIAEGTTLSFPTNSPHVWGGGVGLGYDHAFSQHFISQFEVNYITYQSKDVDSTALDGTPVTNNYKIYSYNVGLSAIYKF